MARIDIGLVCALLIAVIKCDQMSRETGTSLVTDLVDLDRLSNDEISKRHNFENSEDLDDLNLESKRSRINRMPAIFGKRSRLNRMPAVFGKRSRLNRMPAIFGKRSRLNRMPAIFGKRSKLNRMPTYFGKRSRLNRMPAIFGKRSVMEGVPETEEDEDVIVNDEMDLLDFLNLIKSDKITVDEMADVIMDNQFLLSPVISHLMDTNGDGYISLKELQAVKDERRR
ncbi:hypothetical protein LOTGIDRAFT_234765 [Lottia gigantea]|uniref:EF-hand domain-containing protein n=1 Tax=Lottia gigantea TaxID=225164 RepID=V3ZZ93_LOTGI|nr:hypothetical protein LOTGIDRAFT_234765 [Lottia gigantea]ESO87970.1 hypothetical protein LOTGIDRAFT_234765 [Lottia gigantea]